MIVALVGSAAQAAVIAIAGANGYTSPLAWSASVTGPASKTGTFGFDGGSVDVSFTPAAGITAVKKASSSTGIYAYRIELGDSSPYEVACVGLAPAQLYQVLQTTKGGSNTYTFTVTTGTLPGGRPASQSPV